MKNSALVVIDLQNDITKNYREIIENVNEAIDWEKGTVGYLHTAQQPVCGNENIQARNSRRRVGARVERRIRSHLYKAKKQCPDQRGVLCFPSGAWHYRGL